MACKTVEKYERQVLALPKHSFKGGVHPLHDQHEGKTSTSGLPIREYIPDSVDIPMSMSIGAPAAPCVKVGDHVKLGQKIADATGFVSLPVHASVSGEVTAIGTKVLLLGGPTTIITITTTAMTPTRSSSAGARKRTRNSQRPRSSAS